MEHRVPGGGSFSSGFHPDGLAGLSPTAASFGSASPLIALTFIPSNPGASLTIAAVFGLRFVPLKSLSYLL